MVLAIIQSRLSSTRFPRKIMEKIEGKTMLQHVIDNSLEAKLVDKVVVASPHYIEFDSRLKADWFIGSEHDVLDRYYQCAKKYGASIIVRVTSDCPLVRGKDIDFTLKMFGANRFPYVKFAPVNGLDVEVFTWGMLEMAWKYEPKNPYYSEHVTPYMKEFTKLSVDVPNDLEKVKQWIIDGRKQNA